MLMEIIFLLEFVRIVELLDLSIIVNPGFKEKNKLPFFDVLSFESVSSWIDLNWKQTAEKRLFNCKMDLSCQSNPPLQ